MKKTIYDARAELQAQIADLKKQERELELRDKEFKAEASARKEELLAEWNLCAITPEQKKYFDSVKAKLAEVTNAYGCNLPELFEYILSDRQVSYYRQLHQKG